MLIKILIKTTLISLLLFASTLLYQKHIYAYHLLTQTDPIPHTEQLMQQQRYKEAYEYLHYFMQSKSIQNNPKARTLYQQIQSIRNSPEYQSQKIIEGVRTGSSDEAIGQASAIGSDFFVIGDIRDLLMQGHAYLNAQEVDKVLVALSAIGVVASATTLLTLGSSSVAKGGISTLKLAHKSNRIPPWLGDYLITQAKMVKQQRTITPLKPLFEQLEAMRKSVGTDTTLTLLSQTKSFKSLSKMNRLTQHYGHHTPMLLRLSNKRIYTHHHQLKHYPLSTIKKASFYGEQGFLHLLTGGEKHFLKTLKNIKAYSKIGHKEQWWRLWLSLMKGVSDTILVAIITLSTLLLFPWRRRQR
jgi:hypothetical protein